MSAWSAVNSPPAVGDCPAAEQRVGCSGSHPLEPSRTKPWLSSRVPPTQTIPLFCDFIALTASAGLSVIPSLFSSPKAFSTLLSNPWVPFSSLMYIPKPYQLTTLYAWAQRSMPGMQWMNFQRKEAYPTCSGPRSADAEYTGPSSTFCAGSLEPAGQWQEDSLGQAFLWPCAEPTLPSQPLPLSCWDMPKVRAAWEGRHSLTGNHGQVWNVRHPVKSLSHRVFFRHYPPTPIFLYFEVFYFI